MKADSAKRLLALAVQDLFDGECAWVERIGAIRSHIADPQLARFADEQAGRSKEQAARLQAVARDLAIAYLGPDNLWLRAILDDARRDTETVERGPLLDTALIGAMRKGIQSERVSYETAIQVATALDLPDAAAELDQSRSEELAADAELETLLQRIAAETV